MANSPQAQDVVNIMQAVILTHEVKFILTPIFHVTNMYKVHQDALLIPSEIHNQTYMHGTNLLSSVSFSATEDTQKNLNMSLANIHVSKSLEVKLNLPGNHLTKVHAMILRSDKI